MEITSAFGLKVFREVSFNSGMQTSQLDLGSELNSAPFSLGPCQWELISNFTETDVPNTQNGVETGHRVGFSGVYETLSSTELLLDQLKLITIYESQSKEFEINDLYTFLQKYESICHPGVKPIDYQRQGFSSNWKPVDVTPEQFRKLILEWTKVDIYNYSDLLNETNSDTATMAVAHDHFSNVVEQFAKELGTGEFHFTHREKQMTPYSSKMIFETQNNEKYLLCPHCTEPTFLSLHNKYPKHMLKKHGISPNGQTARMSQSHAAEGEELQKSRNQPSTCLSFTHSYRNCEKSFVHKFDLSNLADNRTVDLHLDYFQDVFQQHGSKGFRIYED